MVPFTGTTADSRWKIAGGCRIQRTEDLRHVRVAGVARIYKIDKVESRQLKGGAGRPRGWRSRAARGLLAPGGEGNWLSGITSMELSVNRAQTELSEAIPRH